MFDSKAIKDSTDKKRSKLYLWWIGTSACDWCHDVLWKFWGQPISRIKKMWGWYVNVFRYDYDFDGHSLFAIIEYKLKRMEKALLEGMAYQEDKDMHALALAIKLAGRLRDDQYDMRAYDRVNRRYGKSKHWFEPCGDGSGNSYMRSSRPNVKTKEDEEEEWAYTRYQYEVGERRCNRERRWLFDILHKYLRVWWD